MHHMICSEFNCMCCESALFALFSAVCLYYATINSLYWLFINVGNDDVWPQCSHRESTYVVACDFRPQTFVGSVSGPVTFETGDFKVSDELGKLINSYWTRVFFTWIVQWLTVSGVSFFRINALQCSRFTAHLACVQRASWRLPLGFLFLTHRLVEGVKSLLKYVPTIVTWCKIFTQLISFYVSADNRFVIGMRDLKHEIILSSWSRLFFVFFVCLGVLWFRRAKYECRMYDRLPCWT